MFLDPVRGKLDLTSFDYVKFVQFCVLSGCDYCKVESVGMMAAYDLLEKHPTVDAAIATLVSQEKCPPSYPGPACLLRV